VSPYPLKTALTVESSVIAGNPIKSVIRYSLLSRKCSPVIFIIRLNKGRTGINTALNITVYTKVLIMLKVDIFLASSVFLAPVACATSVFVPVEIISPSARKPQTRKVAVVSAASGRLPALPTQNASTITKSDLTIVCSTAGTASDNISFLSLKICCQRKAPCLADPECINNNEKRPYDCLQYCWNGQR